MDDPALSHHRAYPDDTAAPESVQSHPADPSPPRTVALIAIGVGGAAGTMLRAALQLAAAVPVGQWPWMTMAINVTGAFVLGVLLESLRLRGPDTGRRRFVRLLLGTGFLGGYTTYSTYALETVTLFPGSVLMAVGYSVSSAGLGVAAAILGISVARLGQRRDVQVHA